ncbi:MAG: hypothetical protein ACOY4W_03705 [Thermodesulfobacteriota bacterium]
MKEISLGKGVTVSTPWLNTVEAAAYCNMSREKFMRLAEAANLSFGGESRPDRCYHVSGLDRLLRQTGHTQPAIETVEEDLP